MEAVFLAVALASLIILVYLLISLQKLTSLLVENIQRVREESKDAIDGKFISLQDSLSANLANSRRELSQGLTTLAGSLEGKFESLRTSTEERLEKIRTNVESKLSETIEKSAGAMPKRCSTSIPYKNNI